MSSRTECLLIINDNESHPSPTPSRSTLQNAFGLMITPQPAEHAALQRDRCSRSPLEYNHNYDHTKPPNPNQPGGYSLYVYREPLFNNQEVIIKNLPKHPIVAPTTKKL